LAGLARPLRDGEDYAEAAEQTIHDWTNEIMKVIIARMMELSSERNTGAKV
jgi:hypothetical protein